MTFPKPCKDCGTQFQPTGKNAKFCDNYILIKTFKTVENYHICQDCEKIAKDIIKEKGEINSEELMEICKK